MKNNVDEERVEAALARKERIGAIPLDRFERIIVIGLGGIGTALLIHLCRYLAYARVNRSSERIPLILIDGDDFEGGNRERQDFSASGNKARVKAGEMRRTFPELSIQAVPEFVTKENAGLFILERDLVFVAVDSRSSCDLIHGRCRELKSVVLINGEVEQRTGSVQVYIRWDGTDLTSSRTLSHPNIEAPALAERHSTGEENGTDGGDQHLLFTNLSVASHMLSSFHALTCGELCHEEICFDIFSGTRASGNRRS
jgi:hypothetical protein